MPATGSSPRAIPHGQARRAALLSTPGLPAVGVARAGGRSRRRRQFGRTAVRHSARGLAADAAPSFDRRARDDARTMRSYTARGAVLILLGAILGFLAIVDVVAADKTRALVDVALAVVALAVGVVFLRRDRSR